MTHIPHSLLDAVLRLADAPQRTLSKVTARLSHDFVGEATSSPTPDHVALRLEGVFELLSDLPSAPNTAAALDMACDALHAELPTEAVAAGLYDIDADEIRIVSALGLEQDLLRGTIMPRERCVPRHVALDAAVVDGSTCGADWIGDGSEGSIVLLSPILYDANLLGLIALANPLCAAQFDDHDLELVGYVADRLAGFIQAHRCLPSIAAPAATRAE